MNSTAATTTMASSSPRSTFAIEVSMKLACRNRIRSALMPFGRLPVISVRACSMVRVSSTVSTSGCFSTDTMTADAPW